MTQYDLDASTEATTPTLAFSHPDKGEMMPSIFAFSDHLGLAWTSYGPDYGYEYFYQVSELSCEDEG